MHQSLGGVFVFEPRRAYLSGLGGNPVPVTLAGRLPEWVTRLTGLEPPSSALSHTRRRSAFAVTVPRFVFFLSFHVSSVSKTPPALTAQHWEQHLHIWEAPVSDLELSALGSVIAKAAFLAGSSLLRRASHRVSLSHHTSFSTFSCSSRGDTRSFFLRADFRAPIPLASASRVRFE